MGDGEIESPDQRLAANLRSLREMKGWSQAELADEMRAQGVPWHQQTVTRIEAAEQQVRWRELVTLAGVLGTSLDRFAWTSHEAMGTEFVAGAGKRLRRIARTTADAVVVLLAALEAAEQALDRTADSPYPRVQEARREVTRDMGLYGVEGAVADARRRYAEERKADRERAGNG